MIVSSLARCAAAPALIVVLSSLPLPSGAQTTQVIITGARDALAPERLAGDVVVIDRERLLASSADSLEDLLRREAGLQLSRNGGPGANAGLFIRGSSSANTLVLVDGVRMGAATTGQPELEALSLAHIERIEVLRGPGSSLYGADAVGGVIQIFTRRGQARASRASLGVAIGGFGARQAAAAVSGGNGAIDFASGVSADRNDGVSALRAGDQFGNFNPDRDGYTRRGAHLQLGWTPAAGHRVSLHGLSSRLNAQFDASELAPPTFAPDNTPDFRNRLELDSLSLQYAGRWSERWSTLLRASDLSSELASGGRLIDRFRTDRRQAEVQLTWRPAAEQSLTLAIDRIQEQARSTSYAADVRRDNDAFVVAYAGSFGPLALQLEARHDDSSIYGGVDTGRIGAAWTLGGGWRVRALAGTTFRAPSFNDLFFPGFGVPTLQPERGRSVEGGVQWRSGAHEAELTIYRNRVRDLIGYEPDRRFCPPAFEYDFGCARNTGRARLQGATLSGGTRIGHWQLRGIAHFLDATDSATGARLVRRAAHQETLAIDYRVQRWSAGAEVISVGARPEGGRMLAAYTTIDLQARWTLSPGLQLEARLLNATDRDYEPARDYRPLGRQAWLGVRYEAAGW